MGGHWAPYPLETGCAHPTPPPLLRDGLHMCKRSGLKDGLLNSKKRCLFHTRITMPAKATHAPLHPCQSRERGVVLQPEKFSNLSPLPLAFPRAGLQSWSLCPWALMIPAAQDRVQPLRGQGPRGEGGSKGGSGWAP